MINHWFTDALGWIEIGYPYNDNPRIFAGESWDSPKHHTKWPVNSRWLLRIILSTCWRTKHNHQIASESMVRVVIFGYSRLETSCKSQAWFLFTLVQWTSPTKLWNQPEVCFSSLPMALPWEKTRFIFCIWLLQKKCTSRQLTPQH